MKPSFALNFTDDSIQLLHRTGKGWVPIGETPFAAPDLDEALSLMRKTALGLEPGGFTTKLIIPNSQIRYVEVEAPGTTEESRRAQIATVLESQTPLRADEIAFDWSGKGKTVKVAAVARETLAEAESFATMHRFNPVSFAAIPDYGDFSGEPWFGVTEASSSLLKGETVERDKNPLRILLRELPVPAEAVVAEKEAPSGTPDPEPASLAPALAAEPPISEVETLEEALPAPSPAEKFETVEAATAAEEPFKEILAERERFFEPAPAKPAQDEEAPFTHVTENPAFPEEVDMEEAAPPQIAAVVDNVLPPDDLPPVPPPAAMAAFASRRKPDDSGRPPFLGSADRPDPAALAMAMRGKPIEDLPPMPRPPQAAAKVTVPAAGSKASVAKGLGSLVSGPAIGGSRKAKSKAALVAAAAKTSGTGPAEAAKSLTRPGGTFGNRPAAPKSRTVLFLSLVAILLLCLALIAAWSSFYLSSRSNVPAEGAAVAVASAPDEAADPAVEDEMLADGQELVETSAEIAPATATSEATAAASDAGTAAESGEPVLAEPTANTEETAIDPAVEAVAAIPEAEVEPALPAPGVASEDPDAQSVPDQQDEIFVATADSPPPALDALSLPAPELQNDALPAPQMPPPPFGMVYRFDANGLLIPTPEGIVSPEGVLLIAGKPPVVPPARSETAIALAAAARAAPAAESDALPDAATLDEALPAVTEPAVQPNPELADRRPRSRPEGLAPSADDAALPVVDAVEFASLRPRARPEVVLAAGEKARRETEAASLAAQPSVDVAAVEAALAVAAAEEAANPSVVAISRRPSARPKDFSRAVEAAVAAAIRAPEKQPEQEETAQKAPAPEVKPEELDEIGEPEVVAAPAPKIPTKTSVAKQATFKNAINLSKINLIGVYGTQSKRYAMIRQANGRYKKVYVGDSIDGGRVEAITQSEVRYQKGGRLISLKMPKG